MKHITAIYILGNEVARLQREKFELGVLEKANPGVSSWGLSSVQGARINELEESIKALENSIVENPKEE